MANELKTIEKLPPDQALTSLDDLLPHDPHGTQNSGPDYSELLRRLRKHIWLILVITLSITSIVAIESYRNKSVYRATTTLEILSDNRTLFRSGDVVIESDDIDYGYGTQVAIKSNIRLLNSRPLLEDVVVAQKLDLNARFFDVTERKSIWEAVRTIVGRVGQSPRIAKSSSPPNSPAAFSFETQVARSPQETERLMPYVDLLQNQLFAEPIEDSRMLTISIEHTDPQLAATIANTMAKIFIEHSYRNKTRKYSNTSAWLVARTRELQAKVQEAEANLADYTSANNIFSSDNSENLTIEKLSKVHGLVMQAETDRLLKQSLYEEVRQGRVDQLPEAFADARTAALKARLGELQIQSAQYAGRIGPDNPRVIDLKKQIAAIEKQISESQSTLQEKLKADYERALRDETALREAFNRARADAVQQNQAAIKFSILKQEVETAKALYTEFLNKTSQANIQVAEQHSNINIIDPAIVPRSPVRPNRLRSILLGLALSLAFGVAVALVIEYLDNTVKTTEDVTRFVQLPTLAVIPRMSNSRRRLMPAGGIMRSKSPDDEPVETNLPARISAKRDGQDSASNEEAYRGLRTSVLLSTAGNPPRTILFTSSQPGEGKTTTSINMAISLAQLGANVMLIDADMRRPKVHQRLDVENLLGLSTWLSRDVILDDLIQYIPDLNLSFMASGAIPPNPAELISSSRMKELLRTLSNQFDHIIIDSPPLMNVSDSVILSTMVDGVVLVVQSGKTKRTIVSRARQELRKVGARIFGVVLNDVDLKGDGYDDYYTGKYYSAYNSDGYTPRGQED